MVLLLLLGGAGCGEIVVLEVPYTLAVPQGFPAPDIPADNAMTADRIALGKRLFYDKALSRDYSISCADCHRQELAFTDANPVSVGIQGRLGTRNSPTLVNLAWQPYFFVEGGSPSLEMQALGPIGETHEMGFNGKEAVDRLSADSSYQQSARKAYGRNFDAFVMLRALAAFERTLISGNSPFDQYQYQGQEEALSEAAKRGLAIFTSERAACNTCHPAPFFTDFSFQNIGLRTEYIDPGRFRVSLDSADWGKFKVPTLRNIAKTAPYMHDGSLATLEEVIEHFDQGGVGHRNQSPHVQAIGLTSEEKTDLLAFLRSLTDEDFLRNPDFRPE